MFIATALMSLAILASGSPDQRRANFYPSIVVGEPFRPDGTLPQGIKAQTKQAMDNIGAQLKKSRGLGWENVYGCTLILANAADWLAFNNVYVTYFPTGEMPPSISIGAERVHYNPTGHYPFPSDIPTRITLGTDRPAPGTLVRLKCHYPAEVSGRGK